MDILPGYAVNIPTEPYLTLSNAFQSNISKYTISFNIYLHQQGPDLCLNG